MLYKLKRHLILLYTVITSLILSVVVIGACYMSINQRKAYNLEQFENLRDTIEYKLQAENVINNTWLSELEASNHLIIHIEENSAPFFFKGSWKPTTNRSDMIANAKKVALSEGIDTTTLSVSFDKSRSSIFPLYGNHKEAAYACICIIPAKSNFISLTLIQFVTKEQAQIHRQIFLYAGINILGCFLLFLISCFFVNKALKPVEEGQKRQNEFIAAASHDLRSPLAVIQTNATSLLIDGAEVSRFVPGIVTECARMSRLIGDMLLLASSDAKTWHIKKNTIDTETYLIDLYDSFTSLCQKSNHSLSLDLPSTPLPMLTADKDRLSQVLGILIDNAVSYSPAKSTITLRPYQKKNTFCLDVEDYGIGITNEQKEYIFNRFYRVDKSRNDSSHFGLGLSVAKELMELMDGKISVKDTLGGGTTFVLELPL